MRSPRNQKVNNSYESEPSSSNGSTVDTPTTMEHHDLGISPKLSALLAINNNYHHPDSPTSVIKRHKPVISETAERERVEQAKIYFQRVFASSQQSEFDGLLTHAEREAVKKSPRHHSSLISPPQKRASIEQCYSAEISNQDERCQRELVNVRFYHVNSDISDGSQCSIEPNSSVDVDPGGSSTKTDIDFAQSVFITDNSCNAVDNLIATPQTSRTSAIGELSFDGIIDSMSKSNSEGLKTEQQQMLKLKLLESETSRMQANEQSPDLFEQSDDDDDDPERRVVADADEPETSAAHAVDDDGAMNHKRAHIFKSEKVILGQIQSSLSGLLPPPSVTILQYDILELLSAYKKNESAQTFTSTISTIGKTSEFTPSHSECHTQQLQWPDCLNAKAHGILYNRSLWSESIELLAMRFAERNIGAETCSTFNPNSPSSCKKRSMRMKMLSKSPGNRLSHLAKRRAIFSSANLLKPSLNDSSKLGKNQMVIDTRNRDKRTKTIKVKTPKRRTPGRKRTPSRKTPGSARKRLQQLFAAKSQHVPPTRETSKRALFQNPPKEKPPKPLFPAELAIRVERSKRVLFSPLPPSQRKRARSPNNDSTDEDTSFFTSATSQKGRTATTSTSFGRSLSNYDVSSTDSFQAPPKRLRLNAAGPVAASNAFDNLTPRSLMLAKSQSFSVAATCGEFGQHGHASAIQRANSEQTIGSVPQLSQLHRQKIFWAVATALKNKKISSQHANYKQYASVLAKVIKRFYLELVDRKSISTSTTMLKIADKHVFWVLQGKTEDEIYLNEKQKLDSAGLQMPKASGYVAIDEYEMRKSLARRSTSSGLAPTTSTGVSSDVSFDSSIFGGSGSQQSVTASQIMQATNACSQQSIDFSLLCSDHRLQLSASKSASKTGAPAAPPLTNSSSKSNTKNGVLRENMVDPRSAQKAFVFSGRDQKNVSPYSEKPCSSSHRASSNLKGNGRLLVGGGGGGPANANIMKAKRQISFDS